MIEGLLGRVRKGRRKQRRKHELKPCARILEDLSGSRKCRVKWRRPWQIFGRMYQISVKHLKVTRSMRQVSRRCWFRRGNPQPPAKPGLSPARSRCRRRDTRCATPRVASCRRGVDEKKVTPATASFQRGVLTLALLHQLRDSDCIASGLTVYTGRHHQNEHFVGGKAAPEGLELGFSQIQRRRASAAALRREVSWPGSRAPIPRHP